jgi:hypothetical protein
MSILKRSTKCNLKHIQAFRKPVLIRSVSMIFRWGGAARPSGRSIVELTLTNEFLGSHSHSRIVFAMMN